MEPPRDPDDNPNDIFPAPDLGLSADSMEQWLCWTFNFSATDIGIRVVQNSKSILDLVLVLQYLRPQKIGPC